MKNRVLLLLGILAGSVLQAQHSNVAPTLASPSTVRQVSTLSPTSNNPLEGAAINYTYLDTFYMNTFNDSTQFTQFKAAGSSSDWTFRSGGSTPNGFYTGAFNSSTNADGFVMFDFFGFNNNPTQFANAHITVGPIDLSAATAPLSVNFEQRYARFRDSAQVFYSLDGTTFNLLGGNTDMEALVVTAFGENIGSAGPNPQLKSILANNLAGQPQVWLRFRYKSDFGSYTWLIDDLSVTSVSVPDVDFELNKVMATDNLLLQYAKIPENFADSVFYGVIVTNNGISPAGYSLNWEIEHNGGVVASGTDLIPATTPLGDKDTLFFITDYILNELGTYTLNVSLDASGDFTPDNNTLSTSFEVTDYVYSQLPNLTGATALSASGSSAPYRTFKVGDFFFARNDDVLYAVNVAMPRPVGTANFPLDITIEVYNSQDINNIVNLVDYTLDNTHPSGTTYKTILFDPPIEFSADNLYIIAMSTIDTEKPFKFFGKSDGDLDESTRVNGPFGAGGAVNWFRGWSFTPGIEAIFNPDIAGVKHINSGIELAVYPNPANQNLNLRLVSASAQNTRVQLLDVQGRVVLSRQYNQMTQTFDSIAVGDLANGVYTLQILTDKGMTSQKVVIAH